MSEPTDLPPTSATGAVLVNSEPVPEGTKQVSGVDFDKFLGRDITVAELVDSMTHTGFQGSAVAEAARLINEMVRTISLELFSVSLLFKRNSDTFS